MQKVTFSFFVLTAFLVLAGEAQAIPVAPDSSVFQSAYRQYAEIDPLPIQVPTVVEISLGNISLERYDFGIYDNSTKKFEPYYFARETVVNESLVRAESNANGSSLRMVDGDVRTHSEFLLPENGPGRAEISLIAGKPITSSSLTLLLDNNVALPTAVEVKVLLRDSFQTVVASKKMNGTTLPFPKTTSNFWMISFTRAQAVRGSVSCCCLKSLRCLVEA